MDENIKTGLCFVQPFIENTLEKIDERSRSTNTDSVKAKLETLKITGRELANYYMLLKSRDSEAKQQATG